MVHFSLRSALSASLAVVMAVCAVPAASAAEQQDGVLEKVVFLGRHGVRSPTKSIDDLREMTGFNWPEWSVKPGEMTPHGERALAAMVKAVRARYVRQDILSAHTCPQDPHYVAVWADGADHRTQRTGEIWADHIAPKCGVTAQWAEDKNNPIFNALSVQAITPDEHLAIAHDVMTRLSRPVPGAVTVGLARLQAWVAPGGCVVGHKPDECFQTPTSLEWKNEKPRLKGGVATAGMLAENFLLMQGEGFPESDFGTQRHNVEQAIRAIMPVHEYESQLLRRTPAFAKVKNGLMAAAIRDFLADRTVQDIPGVTPQTRVLVLAGHDSNQDAMMALFGVSWQFADQPDSTAPDTVMAFERWRRPNGHQEVVIRVYHQTMAQLRNAQEPDVMKSVITLVPKNP